MGVVCANVIAIVPAHFLKTNPNVGLEVLDEMADVDRAVRIRQSTRDENISILGGHFSLFSRGLLTVRAD